MDADLHMDSNLVLFNQGPCLEITFLHPFCGHNDIELGADLSFVTMPAPTLYLYNILIFRGFFFPKKSP